VKDLRPDMQNTKTVEERVRVWGGGNRLPPEIPDILPGITDK